jgi:hypothetical protein
VPARACCLSCELIVRSCSFRRSSSCLRRRAEMPAAQPAEGVCVGGRVAACSRLGAGWACAGPPGATVICAALQSATCGAATFTSDQRAGERDKLCDADDVDAVGRGAQLPRVGRVAAPDLLLKDSLLALQLLQHLRLLLHLQVVQGLLLLDQRPARACDDVRRPAGARRAAGARARARARHRQGASRDVQRSALGATGADGSGGTCGLEERAGSGHRGVCYKHRQRCGRAKQAGGKPRPKVDIRATLCVRTRGGLRFGWAGHSPGWLQMPGCVRRIAGGTCLHTDGLHNDDLSANDSLPLPRIQ